MIEYAFYSPLFYCYMSTLYIKNPDFNYLKGCEGISLLKKLYWETESEHFRNGATFYLDNLKACEDHPVGFPSEI